MKGVDLSVWQKGMDLAKVKEAGYGFVILRGGFTGYGEKRTKNKDETFEDFYQQAKRQGLGVGVYWYSCAICRQDGVEEAEYLYEHCLKGKQFDYPVYIDVEEPRWQANRKKGVTDAIIGFCEYIDEKGYCAGVYSNLSWFAGMIDTSRLDRYTKWVASWSQQPPKVSFPGFDMWQNSNNGNIGGYQVDTNVAYADFPDMIQRGIGTTDTDKPTLLDHIIQLLARK